MKQYICCMRSKVGYLESVKLAQKYSGVFGFKKYWNNSDNNSLSGLTWVLRIIWHQPNSEVHKHFIMLAFKSNHSIKPNTKFVLVNMPSYRDVHLPCANLLNILVRKR